jgi:hypothetical protein
MLLQYGQALIVSRINSTVCSQLDTWHLKMERPQNCETIIIVRTLYHIAMSDFAFFRFIANDLLTEEERKDKSEIIRLTEDVLHARGLECDASIAKVSADDLKDILEHVRTLRRRKVREKEAGVEEDTIQSQIS